jgi:hypothetical protein
MLTIHSGRIAAVALLALAGSASAASWPKPDWSLSLEERVFVDSNVLRLSDGDADRLERDPGFQTDVDGVAGIKAEHRVVAGAQLRLSSRSGLAAWLQRITGSPLGRGVATLTYEGKLTSYERSSAKGYGSHRLTAGWRPRWGWGADLSWRKLDNFYLRQYRDRDTGQITGCSLDAHELRLRLRARGADLASWAQRPELQLQLVREDSYYNAWFTEYDTREWSAALSFGLRLPRNLDLGLGYGWATVDNIGFEGLVAGEATTVLSNDESGDGSFEEDRWSLDLGWGPDNLPFSASLGLLLRERWYSSDLGEVLDPVHAGRRDRRYSTELRIVWPFAGNWALIPIIEREWRRSEGPWEGLSAAKDYKVWRTGCGLRWRL